MEQKWDLNSAGIIILEEGLDVLIDQNDSPTEEPDSGESHYSEEDSQEVSENSCEDDVEMEI